MKKFLFLDLDDTVFQTRRKCPPDGLFSPVAYYADGEICSWMTRKQVSLFEWLHQEMSIIPTTARDEAAFARVTLPFSSYAILNHGGTILLPNHDPDPVWHTQIVTHYTQKNYSEKLIHLGEQINQFVAEKKFGGRVRFVYTQNVLIYLVLKDPDWKKGHLEIVKEFFLEHWLKTPEGHDFYIHLNENNLAVLPQDLNKSFAVRYLLDTLRNHYGEILTFGMGDSYTDAPFVTQCDYAIIPPHTQLSYRLMEEL